MSYILEALKKAQAERQLGSTPGIHDAPVLAPAASIAPDRRRLGLALASALVLLVAGASLMRSLTARDAPPAGQVPVPAPAPAQPVPAPSPVVATVASPPPRPVEVPAEPVVKAAPPIKPVQAAPAPVVQAPAAPVPVSPAVQSSDPDDALPLLAELPQAIRGGIPQVTLGGYIYSPVPSERLLLVDKNLRHEGEEVGPGLVLERLLPRAAVMNYRGTRFRMPY